MELDLQDLWSLLCRTADAKKTARGIIHTKKIKKWDSVSFLVDEPDSESEESMGTDILVYSNLPILSFAINPLDHHQLVYVTPKSICEIDTSVSSNYYNVVCFN